MSTSHNTTEASGLTMEQQLQKQLTYIADKLSETNVTITKMSGKIDQLETILNMKVDNNKTELERQIRGLNKEVDALKHKDEKHEDERTQDLKDKQKFTWGIIASSAVAIVSMMLQFMQN